MRPSVTIVGGGVIGLSIAFHLKNDFKVTVIDSGESWRASRAAAGVLFPTSGARATGDAGAYSFKALSLWPDFKKGLGLKPTSPAGITFFEEEGTDNFSIFKIAEETGLKVEEKPAQPSYIFKKPFLSLKIESGQVIKPPVLLKALIKRSGATLVRDKVKDLVFKGDRVIGVNCQEEKYLSDITVVAAGGRGFNFLPEKLRLQVVPLQGEAVLLKTDYIPSDLPGAVYAFGEELLVNYGNGSLWLGGSYHKTDRPGTSFKEIAKIARNGLDTFPFLERAVAKKVISGARPMSPDGLPFIGPTKSDSLFIATGNGKDGILQSPLAGLEMKNWLLKSDGDEGLLPDRKINF